MVRALALRFWARRFASAMGGGVQVVLPDGSRWGDLCRPVATIRMTEWPDAGLRFLDSERWLAQAWVDGRLEVEGDLSLLVRLFYAAHCNRSYAPPRVHSTDRRARRRAIRNARFHYDVGNAFFEAWLGREMTYTCAVFENESEDIDVAQVRKFETVCRKLGLRSGMHVAELGCGWGGLARYMASAYDVRVTAINASVEQVEYARAAAAADGTAKNITFIVDDYRELRGTFDAIVSVGMLEHVGVSRYSELSGLLAGLLAPHGRGLLHFIGRRKPARTSAWLRSFVFPGAEIPSLTQAVKILEDASLPVLDVENLRSHYALTLKCWAAAFDRAMVEERLSEMPPHALRAWRLYLMGAQSAFEVGLLELFQVVFVGRETTRLPLARSYMNVPPARSGAFA